MLLLVFIAEYFSGELLFNAIDSEIFLLYFAGVTLIDALVCQFLLKFTKGWRTELYVILSVMSIILHTMGAWMYQYSLDDSFYVFMLWIVFFSKALLLEKAIRDAGNHTSSFANSFISCMGIRPTGLDFTQSKERHRWKT